MLLMGRGLTAMDQGWKPTTGPPPQHQIKPVALLEQGGGIGVAKGFGQPGGFLHHLLQELQRAVPLTPEPAAPFPHQVRQALGRQLVSMVVGVDGSRGRCHGAAQR